MGNIKVEGLTQLQRQFQVEAPDRMRQLSVQTLNRAARRGQTRLVRYIRDDYGLNLKAEKIRDVLTIRQARRDDAIPNANLRARKRPLLLSNFDAVQRTKLGVARKGQPRKRVNDGISIRYFRNGVRQVLPGTFLFRSPFNGALISAVRRPKAGGGKNRGGHTRRVDRLPVDPQYGRSVDQLYKKFRPTLAAELREYILEELDRRIAKETLGNQARGLVR